jgi:D-lactate dehydrogenase
MLSPAVQSALPADRWLLDEASRYVYGFDNSKRHGPVLGIAMPQSEAEVQSLVRACAASGTPIVARGRGTATTGATVPVAPSVILSCERLNRILRIEPANRLAVVEPGVINGDLQAALRPCGMFWPPDPTSAPYATVGGNLACNAGGPRAVRYGASRDNVLGLRIVAGNGELASTGSMTTKGAVGLDLTRLIVGAEGALGVITAATLKLTPLPAMTRSLRALYASTEAAAEAVGRLLCTPAAIAAIEFMDATALSLVRDTVPGLPADTRALLMIDVDGGESIGADVALAANAAQGEGCIEVRQARDDAESAALWAARKALSPVLRSLAPRKINEDVVVPVARLPALMGGVERLAAEYRLLIVCFGHAGNGNLHVNLLFDPALGDAADRAQRALAELFDLVLNLEGTLSGEHGIGLDKRPFVAKAVDATSLRLMRAIKREFDPAGIFNPGKGVF